MRKITLFAAAVAVFVLIGIDAWLCVRTFPDSAIAGSFDNATVTMTGARVCLPRIMMTTISWSIEVEAHAPLFVSASV